MESKRKYYFLTIAETLNITRAAEKLRISQPSLTQYLNQLERELEAVLLDRKYTPLRLTDAGQIYYNYLKDCWFREQEMHAAIIAVTSGERQPLRIGLPLQKSQNVTETILPLYTSRYPNASFSIWEGTSTTVRHRVIHGELEIGFGHVFSDEDPECEICVLRSERVLILCHRKNPAVAGEEASLENPLRVSPEALGGQRWYEMAPEYILHNVEQKEMQQYGIKPAQRIVMSHLYSRIAEIASGPNSGFAFTPDYLFQESFPKSMQQSLAFLTLGEEAFTWYFAMLRKKRAKMTREARRFWDCIENNHTRQSD